MEICYNDVNKEKTKKINWLSKNGPLNFKVFSFWKNLLFSKKNDN